MYPEDTPKEEIIKNSHFIWHVICDTCRHFNGKHLCKLSNRETDKYWYCPQYERM